MRCRCIPPARGVGEELDCFFKIGGHLWLLFGFLCIFCCRLRHELSGEKKRELTMVYQPYILNQKLNECHLYSAVEGGLTIFSCNFVL